MFEALRHQINKVTQGELYFAGSGTVDEILAKTIRSGQVFEIRGLVSADSLVRASKEREVEIEIDVTANGKSYLAIGTQRNTVSNEQRRALFGEDNPVTVTVHTHSPGAPGPSFPDYLTARSDRRQYIVSGDEITQYKYPSGFDLRELFPKWIAEHAKELGVALSEPNYTDFFAGFSREQQHQANVLFMREHPEYAFPVGRADLECALNGPVTL